MHRRHSPTGEGSRQHRARPDRRTAPHGTPSPRRCSTTSTSSARPSTPPGRSLRRDGIILIDTIYDYSVEDEVAGGLKKLGLDPATIKYAIVSHGHGDHSGGAKFLQDSSARASSCRQPTGICSTAAPARSRRRDMVATDGMKLTLGDTTLTLYITPGHTLGTISTLIPVKDNGQPHLAAEWGGTAFNWMTNSAAYITPDRPATFWFDTYTASAQRFRDIVAREGADIVIANHTIFDGSKTKIPALADRKPASRTRMSSARKASFST